MFVPPDPDGVVARLSPILPHLYRGVEAGLWEARSFFLDRGDQSSDPYLFPNIFRYVCGRCLRGAGLDATEERSADIHIAFDDLANNGVQFAYDDMRIRIRKAANGGLPGTRGSQRLEEFYQQILPLGAGDGGHTVNLVILWDVTPHYVMKPHLWLACPAGGTTSVGLPHWIVPLPHPAEMHAPPLTGDGHEPDDDLEVTPRGNDIPSDQQGG